jgi:PST family polysaccharide transporter
VQLTLGVAAGAVPFLACLAIPAYRRDLAQIAGFVKQVRKPARAAPGESATTPGASEASAEPATGEVDEVIRDDAAVMRERKAES